MDDSTKNSNYPPRSPCRRYGVFQQFLISFLLKDNREDADPDDLQPGESERGWVAAEESIAFGETETTGIEQDEPHTLEGRKRGGEELSGNSSSTLRITFIRRQVRRVEYCKNFVHKCMRALAVTDLGKKSMSKGLSPSIPRDGISDQTLHRLHRVFTQLLSAC